MSEPNASRQPSRRRFLHQAGLAGATLAAGCAPRVGAAGPRPNLLFLLADDMRADAMGCAGHRLLRTPHLDRLAAEGVRFVNGFVTTSICAPNRACVLLGQHQRSTGIKDFATPLSDEQLDRTYPVLLRRAGYRTGFLGKWGVGASNEKMLENPASRFDYWRGFVGQGKFFWEVDGKRLHLTTELIPRQTAEFLDGCQPGQPWCLSISFKAPHGPWSDYDPKLKGLYTGDDLPTLPKTFTKEHYEALPRFLRESLNCLNVRHYDARWGSREDPDAPARMVADYYRLITGLDICVGKLRALLAERGMAGDTVIAFTSDNGHFLFEQGLMGKWLMHEPSIRVPFVVYDPRLPAERRGTTRDEMALTVDMAPTMLAMAGLRIPKAMQGRDLSPLLAGRRVGWRDDWFYEHTFTLPPPRTIAKSQGVRTARWKYVRYLETNPHTEQLFDLAADPDELDDLADDPRHQDVLAHLRARYQHYRKALPDVHPEPAEYGYFRTVHLSGERADAAYDFAPARALAQSFKAEGVKLDALRFRTPTWGERAVPAGLLLELRADGPDGKLLAQHAVPQGKIRNNGPVEWRLGQAVTLGQTLCLSARPQRPVPARTVGWWGYRESLYRDGTASIDGEPQAFDLALIAVYEDPEGFVAPARPAPPPRTRFPIAQGRERRRGSPDVAGKAIAVTATVEPKAAGGVIVCQGGSGNGFALYLKGGRLAFAVRRQGKLTEVVAPQPLPKGRVLVAGRLGKDGAITLSVSGKQVASGKAPGPLPAQPGDPLACGSDPHTAVGPYPVPSRFPGVIRNAIVTVTD